jgi:hypothetical protein
LGNGVGSVLGNGVGSDLGNGVGIGAPDVNVVAPRGPIPFTGAVNNASGNKGLENAAGLNPVARGVRTGNVVPNLNVTPSGSPAAQGRAARNLGTANFSAAFPAAPGTGAAGPAPGGNTVSGATTSTPPGTGGALGGNPLGGNPLGGNPLGGNPLSNPPGRITAPGGAAFPPATGQAAPTAPAAPPSVKGISSPENQKFSPTGLATVAEDGVSTKIVPARPCSSAARETDGTSTCVGIPGKR